MNIRGLEKSDIDKVKEIHEKFYKTEFDFPDFFTNFLCSFVVESDKDIVTSGGIRLIPEIVLVTNKDSSVRERQESLYSALNVSSFVAQKHKHEHIHAFVTDEVWERHLKKVGFSDCIGKALSLGV